MSIRRISLSDVAALILITLTCIFGNPNSAFASPSTGTETIVIVRHGEKPSNGLGQLDCRGLNRALALPKVLISRYGKPNFIFAPNPSVQIHDGNSPLYSYVRPLATIEPTAIFLGMPVNTQIGFNQIHQLQAELTKPKYAHSLIFVAWEHGYQDQFARNLVKAFGGNPSAVPGWSNNDYDTIFVIRLKHVGAKRVVSFAVNHEGLNGELSNTCPSAP